MSLIPTNDNKTKLLNCILNTELSGNKYNELRDIFGKTGDNIFNTGEQKDAWEALNPMLNTLHEALPEDKKIKVMQTRFGNDNKPITSQIKEGYIIAKFDVNDKTPLLSKLFQRAIVDYESGSNNVEEYYIQKEIKISKDVDEFVIALVRFVYEAQTATKIQTGVALDNITIEGEEYIPASIILHTGTINNGHYMAMILTMDKTTNQKEWFLVNDTSVTENNGHFTQYPDQPYVVRYIKKSNEINLLPEEGDITGLNNTGNSCYLNSAIQFTNSMSSVIEERKRRKDEQRKPEVTAHALPMPQTPQPQTLQQPTLQQPTLQPQTLQPQTLQQPTTKKKVSNLYTINKERQSQSIKQISNILRNAIEDTKEECNRHIDLFTREEISLLDNTDFIKFIINYATQEGGVGNTNVDQNWSKWKTKCPERIKSITDIQFKILFNIARLLSYNYQKNAEKAKLYTVKRNVKTAQRLCKIQKEYIEGVVDSALTPNMQSINR